MTRGLKILGLIVLTFLIVWAVVILQWQHARRMPDARDVVLYLIALPIGLLLVFWLLRAGIDRLRRPAAPAPEAPDAQTAATEQTQAAQARERALSARVLTQAVHLPIGADAASVIEALRDPATRPKLDKTLKNADSFPVAAARIETVADDDPIRAALDAIAPGVQWKATSLRAIAALEPVLAQALDAIAAALPEPAQPDPRGGAPEPPMLRIAGFVSERMSEPERQALAHWITRHCAHALDARRALSQVSLMPVRNGTDALLGIDRWILNVHKRDEQEILLALAADSSIAQTDIDRLAAAGNLFGADSPNGVVPGEAAAALVLARADMPLQWPQVSVQLHRIGLGKRDKSADAGGRIAGDLHTSLAQQSLELAQVAPSDVQLVYTDMDHRASRALELGALMNALLPELDPVQDRCALGIACGDIGAASALATVALAASALLDDEAPALVLSSFDACERAATIVRRTPKPPTPTAT